MYLSHYGHLSWLSSYGCFFQAIVASLKLWPLFSSYLCFFQAMANFFKPFQTFSSLFKFMATSKRNMKHHISKKWAPLESQNVEIHDKKKWSRLENIPFYWALCCLKSPPPPQWLVEPYVILPNPISSKNRKNIFTQKKQLGFKSFQNISILQNKCDILVFLRFKVKNIEISKADLRNGLSFGFTSFLTIVLQGSLSLEVWATFYLFLCCIQNELDISKWLKHKNMGFNPYVKAFVFLHSIPLSLQITMNFHVSTFKPKCFENSYLVWYV